MDDNNRNSIANAFKRHISSVEESVNSILPDIERSAEILLESVKNDKKILVCGNGGSAADAQHLSSEFVCKYKDDRRPLAAVALTTDTSALTAISNDYGFEYIFSRQVEAIGSAGDVLVAISTSGKSPNILRAVDSAKKIGMKIILLTGMRGAKLKNSVDVAVVVPTEETARIQEIHGIIIHSWCEFVDGALLK